MASCFINLPKTIIPRLRSINSAVSRSFATNERLRMNITHSKKCVQNLCAINQISNSRSISSNCILNSHDSNAPKSDDTSNNEQDKKASDNEDFRGILKDFSKDFEMNGDAHKMLNEIKQKMKNLTNEHNSAEENKIVAKDHEKPSLSSKQFTEFVDKDAKVIFSYEEELLMDEDTKMLYHISQEEQIKSEEVEVERGVFGVYDIQELVEVLREENLFNISAIAIPKSFAYADHLVLATAKSPRHAKAVMEYIVKLYKRKKHKSDPFVKIEGENVFNWKALDMGNIVLHVFLEEARACYDIESLWVLDSEYDSGGLVPPDPNLSIIEEQIAFFNQLQEPESKDPTQEAT